MKKKIGTLLLVLTAGLGATACGDDDSSTPDATDTSDGVDTAPDTTPDTTPDETPDETPDGGDATVSPACEAFCDAVVTASCENGPTEEECLTRCATGETSCGTEQTALDGCLADPPVVGCDSEGFPIATGCEEEHLRVMACVEGDYCARLCTEEVLEDCDGGPPSVPVCLRPCRQMEAVCATPFDAFETCTGDPPNPSCAVGGDMPVVFTGCESQFDAMIGCAVMNPCDALCPSIVAASCSAGPPDLGSCVGGCVGAAFGGCIPQLHALAGCAGTTPTVTCDGSGGPAITGCETQLAAFTSCMEG